MVRYYIDLENVGTNGIDGFENLQSDANLNLLYSVNYNKMLIKVVEAIYSSAVQTKFHYVGTKGSNALDFYLTALVISDIEKYGGGSYYIISKDSDFRHLEAFVNEKYIDKSIRLIRCESIKDAIIQNLKTQKQFITENDYLFLAK